METETANSREKKQDIGRKKEIWRYVVTKRTLNTQHTQTGRQTGRQAGAVEPAGRKAKKKFDVLATVHERNIATFYKWLCAGLLSPRPPAPLISVLGVVVILFSDLFLAPFHF